MLEFYIQFHRYDKLFENYETFRGFYKTLMSKYLNPIATNLNYENLISYIYSICRDAYLSNSIVELHWVYYRKYTCYRLNATPTKADCDFKLSRSGGNLTTLIVLLLKNMDIMVEENILGPKAKWLTLNFQDLPSPNIVYASPAPAETNLNTRLYQAYLDQKFTDVTLVTNDRRFTLHKNVLYSMGGTFFERLYNSDFKPPSTEISITGYTSETVSLYIDYLYLETAAFENKPNINVIELFELANEYLQLNLQRDCLHLINAHATPEDLDALIGVNARYSDPFLKDIIIWSGIVSRNDKKTNNKIE